MKKIVTTYLLSLALLLSMAACASTPGGNTDAPTPTPETNAPASDAPSTPALDGAPEGYPDGPVTMLVGYTAGGGSDLAIRTFDEFFGPLLGEAVTVSNLPGGGATVAVAELQNREADGQSIGLVTLSTQSVSPYSLDLPYTIDDFEYLGCFGAYTYALLVPAESPYQSFDDLLEAIAQMERMDKVQETFETFLSGYEQGVNSGIAVKSRSDYQENFENARLNAVVVDLLIGGVLLLIGLLNVVNAMVTKIVTRKKEFAIYESLGMTVDQLRRLLALESALYGAILLSVVSLGTFLLTWFGLPVVFAGMNTWCMTYRYTFTPLWCRGN